MNFWIDTDSGTYGATVGLRLLDVTDAQVAELEQLGDSEISERGIKDGVTVQSYRLLSISDVSALWAIVDVAHRKARIGYLADADSGAILHGVARAITKADGNFLSNTDDIREVGHLWVSGLTESFLPIKDLIPAYRKGFFVIDYTG